MSNRLVELLPFFNSLLRSSDLSYAFADEDSKVLFVSPAILNLLNVRDDEIIGRSIFDLFEFQGTSKSELVKKRKWQGLAKFKNSTLELSVSQTAPSAGKKPGFVIECKQAVEKSAEVARGNELEALGVLSCRVAHDLNNILAGILGHVSFLRLSLPLNGSDQESLETIEQGTRKAAQLTKQVLEFAQGQQLEPVGVCMGEVVRDVVKLIQTSVPQDVVVKTSGLDSGMFVVGDEGQLNQLILNLAVNARDAVGDSGEIRIELAQRGYHDKSACAEIGIQPGEYIVLSVRDTGPGIDESIRAKIFEPFFTTKQEQGTGLGLATVQAIVSSHGGLLVVDTAPGQGTCFEISLPKSKPGLLAEEARNTKIQPPVGSEKVLIVDDEDAVRMIMEKSLEHLGYEVVSATSGHEALELFKKDEFKLIILDMIMPGMPGDEVFAALKKVQADLPVLIASGYASDSRIRSMLSQGALGYIQKPFSVEELAQEVRNCLDSKNSTALDSEAA